MVCDMNDEFAMSSKRVNCRSEPRPQGAVAGESTNNVTYVSTFGCYGRLMHGIIFLEIA